MSPRRSPQPTRHRALELIVAHPDGCTEAILAAESIPADVLIELVRSGLAVTRIERLDDEDGVLEVTKVWDAGAGGGTHVAAGRPKGKAREAGVGTRT